MYTENVRAAGIMSLAVVAFVAQDAAMKGVAGGMSMIQALALRNALVTLVFVGLAAATGALRQWRTLAEPLVWSRSAADTGATLLYMLSLTHLPLTLVVALNMATPLCVLPLAGIFLRERLGWRRVLAVLTGFVGVLLVLRPTAGGLSAWALLSAASAVFFAARDIMTRRVPARVPNLLVGAVMTAVLMGVCLIWTAWEGWTPVSPAQWTAVGGASALIAAGYYLAIVATRMGDVSLTSAFRYTALPWGAVWGYALWGEVPDAPALAGAALILGAGLYALHRERREARPAGHSEPLVV
ncbi:MAG: DMT family transporter [Candidatus Latescibacteria bacterium]|nr:DMT family transporter [Candidatus Latescibacterota bacterium]